MTTPEPTTATSGMNDHTPTVLCQLKSRALPDVPRRNAAMLRKRARVQVRGHHRKSPLTTMKKKPRFAAPVRERPRARRSPVAASVRCQEVTERKKSRFVVV